VRNDKLRPGNACGPTGVANSREPHGSNPIRMVASFFEGKLRNVCHSWNGQGRKRSGSGYE